MKLKIGSVVSLNSIIQNCKIMTDKGYYANLLVINNQQLDMLKTIDTFIMKINKIGICYGLTVKIDNRIKEAYIKGVRNE